MAETYAELGPLPEWRGLPYPAGSMRAWFKGHMLEVRPAESGRGFAGFIGGVLVDGDDESPMLRFRLMRRAAQISRESSLIVKVDRA